MMKLDFMLIGASKCATSSIGALIRSHPGVHFLHEADEKGFFARDEVFARGRAWYESLFEDAPPGAVLGASCNLYSELERFPEPPHRIADLWPESKILYVVRDPLARIPSMWMQLLGGGKVHFDLQEALRRDEDWLVGSSRYWSQLQPYRELFGDERIHVVFYEDFRQDKEQVLRDCFEFLGADPEAHIDWSRSHLNPTRGKKVPPTWLWRLRSGSSLYGKAKHLVPPGLRDWLKKKVIFRPVQGKPELDRETREWIRERVREDGLRLLEYCGKPRDFWSLD